MTGEAEVGAELVGAVPEALFEGAVRCVLFRWCDPVHEVARIVGDAAPLAISKRFKLLPSVDFQLRALAATRGDQKFGTP